MLGEHGKRHPIQILVNYWEMQPAEYGSRLDELARADVSQVLSFVPWQAFESDISHALLKFLQTCAERKMEASLILTPELGIHYPNSGLPKDLFSKEEDFARDSKGRKIRYGLPPTYFSLPSMCSDGFSKRYYGFLSRFNVFLCDLERSHPKARANTRFIVSGGLWKNYRSVIQSTYSPFEGEAGDYSRDAIAAYRRCLDEFFSQKEFAYPDASASARWKTKDKEKNNLKWFFQQTEDVFRHRSSRVLRRNLSEFEPDQLEVFTPEADPGVFYSNLLRMMGGGSGSFAKYDRLIDEYSHLSTHFSGESCPPFVHWTSLGDFRALSDAERQFLIWKSILLMGARGGGVILDHNEWLAFSSSFRNRVSRLATGFAKKLFELKPQAYYLTHHAWSSGGAVWDEMKQRLPWACQLTSDLSAIQKNPDANLVVVDPDYILTENQVSELIGWSRAGRVVAIPQSSQFSEPARNLFEKRLVEMEDPIEIRLGIPYWIHSSGTGKVLLYDSEPSRSSAESENPLGKFVRSIFALSNLEHLCQLSDDRLQIVPLFKPSGQGRGISLFLMNPSKSSVTGKIVFKETVEVRDMAQFFAGGSGSEPSGRPADRFELEVPPFGVLPLSVEGMMIDHLERRRAENDVQVSADEIAEGALNFDSKQQGMDLWL